MSTPAAKILYDLDKRLDLVSGGQTKALPLVDRIGYLNDFLKIWFNNSVREAERNQEAANELRAYKQDRYELQLKDSNSSTVFAAYPTNLHTRLNQVATLTETECCAGIKKSDIPIRILTSDKIQPARKNPLKASNFYFERLNAVISNGGLLIYHDGACGVESVLIDYYRTPIELHVPTHEECAGKVYYNSVGEILTEDTYLESDSEYVADFIADGAALLATADKNEPNKFELQLKKFLQSRAMSSVRD